MNESISMLKLTIITALGVIAAYFNALMIPIVVLVFVMVTDYISGMASAKKSGELSSSIGIMGIAKKVGYLALVAVGMVVDYLISSALVHVGIEIQINYCFAMIIVIWLCYDHRHMADRQRADIYSREPRRARRADSRFSPQVNP